MPFERFQDFDAYEDAMSHAEVQMTLHRRERSKWEIGERKVLELSIQWGSSGGSMSTEGESHTGGFALFIPLNRCFVNRINGQRLHKGSLMVAGPGSEFYVSADGANDWCSVFVPLHSTLLKAGAEDHHSHSKSTVVNIGSCRLGRMRRAIRELAASASQNESDRVLEQMRGQVVQHLSAVAINSAANVSERGRGRSTLDRFKILRHALNRMQRRPLGDLQVGELAAELDVSERTLRRTFREWLGVSPARFAGLKQLHRLRDALMAADPDYDSVTDVFLSQGISQFGRIAGSYRELFSELPSQTLKRRRASSK